MAKNKRIWIIGIVAVAVAAWAMRDRIPTYAPAAADELALLQRLDAAFPAEYAVVWRQHGTMRRSDLEVQREPSRLRGAVYTHNLSTWAARSEGAVYVQVSYAYFDTDHGARIALEDYSRYDQLLRGQIHADETVYGCSCNDLATSCPPTDCYTILRYGNYRFQLLTAYNKDNCVSPQISGQRRTELRQVIEKFDKLVYESLQRLR